MFSVHLSFYRIYNFLLLILLAHFHLISGQCSVPHNFDVRTPDITDWDKDSYDVGSQITYKCDGGFRKDRGSGSSTCEANGKWTEPDLECLPIQCSAPLRPMNGRVIGTEYTFGKEVKFECDRGYVFEDKFAQKQAICLTDGWTASTPNCIAIVCPTPENILNGRPEYSTLKYGFKVTYKCDPGYKIDGTAERECREDGTWSDSVPKCNVVRCPNPTKEEYKMKHDLRDVELAVSISPGDKVTFVCNNGKQISSTCSSTGDWSPPPSCRSESSSSTMVTPTSGLKPTDAGADATTEPTPEEPSGMPSWLIILVSFAGSSLFIVVLALLIRHGLKKRKRSMK